MTLRQMFYDWSMISLGASVANYLVLWLAKELTKSNRFVIKIATYICIAQFIVGSIISWLI